jgi:hypothetical protein
LLAIFPLFHASAEHNFDDGMLPKHSCILFTMQAVMLFNSLNKMPIFESISKNTFLDISHQSSNGPVMYSVLSPYVKYDSYSILSHHLLLLQSVFGQVADFRALMIFQAPAIFHPAAWLPSAIVLSLSGTVKHRVHFRRMCTLVAIES